MAFIRVCIFVCEFLCKFACKFVWGVARITAFQLQLWQSRIAELKRVKPRKNTGLRLLEKACGELVQQSAYILRCVNKNLPIHRGAVAVVHAGLFERVLKRAGHVRQGAETYGCGAARQRVRQCHRRRTYPLMPLKRPFGNFRDQAARPFIGFVQINVVQRNADTQATDYPGFFIIGIIKSSVFVGSNIFLELVLSNDGSRLNLVRRLSRLCERRRWLSGHELSFRP